MGVQRENGLILPDKGESDKESFTEEMTFRVELEGQIAPSNSLKP